MNRLLLIIFLLCMTLKPAFTQDMLGYVEVKGSVKDGLRPLPNANVEIYANNTLLKLETTDITGNFAFILELNRDYEIKFTREFYVTKMIEFNTDVRQNELGIWLFQFTVELFPDIEGIDFSFLEKEPVGKISYEFNYGEFEHDHKYTRKVHERIKDLLENYNSARGDAYEKVVKRADSLLKNGEQINAINAYRRASILDRSNDYPAEQMLKIDKDLKKSLKGYDRYISLLQNADSLFKHHRFRQARFHYNLALDIVEGSSYARYKVKHINELLPMFDPSYIRLQQYRRFLAKADQLVSEVKYREAIEYYNKALSIQKGDTYALKQISFLRSQIARKQSQSDKHRKYQEYVDLADRYFESQALSAARVAYLKALEVNPDQRYPQIQVEKIDRILYPEKVKNNEKEFPGFTKVERNDVFLNKLARKYPNGKTVEYYDLPGKKITRVIIVENKLASEYLEVRYDYGTFFFRNGQNISRAIFISETNR